MKTTFKKTLSLLSIALIGISLISCADNEKKGPQVNTENKQAIRKLAGPTEDTLDLSRHPDDVNFGNLRIEMSQYTVHLDSAKPFDQTLESIRKSAIDSLKKLALMIDNSYTGRYLLAVKITYGVNPINKKMKLFYQPVLLKNITNGTQKTDVVYTVSVSPTYYKYIDSPKPNFVAVGQATVDAMAEYYRLHVTFKRNDNSHYRLFNAITDTDSTADVKSVMFPIQELDSIMGGNTTDVVRIFNAVDNMYVGGVPYLKHSVLLGPEKMVRLLPAIFYRKYGNLSHLCPPSCNTEKKFNLTQL